MKTWKLGEDNFPRETKHVSSDAKITITLEYFLLLTQKFLDNSSQLQEGKHEHESLLLTYEKKKNTWHWRLQNKEIRVSY